eukprot:13329614-Ditylum_brightwellii.AAC.1
MLLSIANQMANRFPEYHAHLARVIAEQKFTREVLLSDKTTLSALFTAFIEKPLKLVKTTDPKDRYVIVIDGLDECYRTRCTDPKMANKTPPSSSSVSSSRHMKTYNSTAT